MTNPEIAQKIETAGVDWLKLLGFTVGEEIVIFPIGISSGQALQGVLVDIAIGASGPILVVIRNAEGRPNVSVPWSSIMMITKAEGPAVQAPDLDLAGLVEFADKQGVEVPDDVRQAALEF